MKTLILAASAAALLMTAHSADAATRRTAMGASVAAPKQPIPYARLDEYMKASPAKRARTDWWSDAGAQTGMSANTAARSPAMPGDTTAPQTGMDATAPGSTAVNPTPNEMGSSSAAQPSVDPGSPNESKEMAPPNSAAPKADKPPT